MPSAPLVAGLLLALLPAPDPLGALPDAPRPGVRVYLVRHGQALSNLDPTPDLPPEGLDHLTDLGKSQSEGAGRALRHRGITAVLSSPANRARETAERIAKALGLKDPEVEPRLQPLRLGQDQQGRPLDWDARIASWEAGRDPSPPGGESMAEMGERVAVLVAALAQRGGGSVVVVAHAEVIASYLGQLRATPPPKRYPPGLANASISVVDAPATGAPRLLLANLVPQMP